MKVISVHQPWASLIVCGAKTIENRGWRTDHTGPLAIHAARTRVTIARMTDGAVHAAKQRLECGLDELPYGAIVGEVELVECVRFNRQRFKGNQYARGPWCWILRNARALVNPLPWRGNPLMFNIPDGRLRRRQTR